MEPQQSQIVYEVCLQAEKIKPSCSDWDSFVQNPIIHLLLSPSPSSPPPFPLSLNNLWMMVVSTYFLTQVRYEHRRENSRSRRQHIQLIKGRSSSTRRMTSEYQPSPLLGRFTIILCYAKFSWLITNNSPHCHGKAAALKIMGTVITVSTVIFIGFY